MGADGLHPRFRRPAPARRAHRRLHGPQAHVPHRAAGLRRGVGHRRYRPERRAALRRAWPAGRLRGAARSRGARAHRGHVRRTQGARSRVRRVRCDRRRRRRDRSGARRHPHRVLLLALVPRRQRAHRDRRIHRSNSDRLGKQGARRHALRHPRRRTRYRRARVARVRLHPGGQAGRGLDGGIDGRFLRGVSRPAGRVSPRGEPCPEPDVAPMDPA